MQVGESCTGPASPSVPPATDEALCLEIIEVEFLSTIKVAYAKAAVSPPHYKKGEDYIDGDGFSRRPAVILLESSPKAGSSNSAKVKVKVEITASVGVSGNGTLIGTIGALTMRGECPTSVGIHEVDVELDELSDVIIWENSAIVWGMEVPSLGRTIELNSTRVELFGIPDEPLRAFRSTPGVWSEVLRFLVRMVPVLGFQRMDETSAQITWFFHNRHGLVYDHENGMSRYMNLSTGIFAVDPYMKKDIGNVVNCYDQAGAVQVSCAALGIPCEYYLMQPFGSIQSLWFVGSLRCNNPFFRSASLQGAAYDQFAAIREPDIVDTPAVHNVYLRRTGFRNHAFCSYNAKILDACAGPAQGTDSPSQYLAKTIDYATHAELKSLAEALTDADDRARARARAEAGIAANIVNMSGFVVSVT